MQKLVSFIVFVFFFTGPQALASEFFNGCYKTLELNGESVLLGPDAQRSQSTIFTVAANEFYYDLDTRRPLRTRVISLFAGHRDGWSTFINPLVFEDQGEFFESETALNYEFAGHVYHRNSYYGLDKVDFAINISLGRHMGLVRGEIKLLSEALDRQTNLEIILKEVECAQ